MNFNLDMAYKRVGEFGRAQFLLSFVNCVARNAGAYIYYPFAYLVLEQKFLCAVNPEYATEAGTKISYAECSAEKICRI